MKKIIIGSVFTFCAVVVVIVLSRMQTNTPYAQSMHVGGHKLNIQIVQTQAAMAQGLSNRLSMEENQGMVFDFGNNSNHVPVFWMKDMNFPLDFIWISQHTVVGITANAPALHVSDSELPRYVPPRPVDMVLEVNAGWADRNAIATGSLISIP